MQLLKDQTYAGERALFFGKDLQLEYCIFEDGESPLKESRHIALSDCTFRWKYPIWYADDVVCHRCVLDETARSGVWYSHHVTMEDCVVNAPKTFRRAGHVTLRNVDMPNAYETLWHCHDVILDKVKAKGDYLGMDCTNVLARSLNLDGNYCFDGASNVRVADSFLNSKDSFWNTNDVVVENSTIIGEYLGWNSRNLTLVNCTIESLQGMCYIDNLRLINCTLRNTTLAFEYCTVDADIAGGVDSVLNPTEGVIRADYIGELIIQPDRVDPKRTQIILRK